MKKIVAIIVAMAGTCFAVAPVVMFSPKGGCEKKIVLLIQSAKVGIRVQAYAMSSKPIIAALIEARGRSVLVDVVVDSTWNRKSPAGIRSLSAGGVMALLDASHPIAHNKIMIIDDRIVVTGSFNYTHQAEQSNAENLVIIDDKKIAAAYTANFETHKQHSKPQP